jgi:hypothetical protein
VADLAPVIPLASYRAARQVPDVEPEPDYRETIDALHRDWLAALDAAGGDPWLAHLWATQQLLDDVSETKGPRQWCRFVSACCMRAIVRITRRRAKR